MSFYLPLFLFCISAIVTPGPNNLMLLISSIKFGVRRTLPHYVGICLGFPLMVLIVGLGLETIFVSYPKLHLIIKVVGAIYMIWLAIKIILSSSYHSDAKNSKPLGFKQAILFQWVNPKAWVMAIGVISTYTIINANMALFIQVIIISIVVMVVSFCCTALWLFGGNFVKVILSDKRHLKIFNLVLGLLLILSIVMMIFE
ncbi:MULTISPECIES: LysE family translocator [unclassified Francisella]|uniref:LysE family translocator n=1 Tax=unclassified Francisella TaxID=2610885 RepID=UPI002E30BF74|nr:MULTISPECIES: LysE family translocator [unclassified Francisella]MED7820287.1 LysE family translocator [Francisella sp. 19S2-4]MED7831122.1 LysE family translocator [Francisella sp. 19S2-10]